jgi:hypothetical protein
MRRVVLAGLCLPLLALAAGPACPRTDPTEPAAAAPAEPPGSRGTPDFLPGFALDTVPAPL